MAAPQAGPIPESLKNAPRLDEELKHRDLPKTLLPQGGSATAEAPAPQPTRAELEEPMVFDDAEPIYVPVTIRGKQYMLVEADTDTAIKFQDCNMRAARWDSQKMQISGFAGLTETQVVLLCGCLKEVRKDDKGNVIPDPVDSRYPALGRVAEGFIRNLPYSITGPLFLRARAISPAIDLKAGIGKAGRDLGNALAGGTSGSTS